MRAAYRINRCFHALLAGFVENLVSEERERESSIDTCFASFYVTRERFNIRLLLYKLISLFRVHALGG